jgi:hypothetical protein
MKQRVLGKMALFHALLKNNKNKKARSSAVLNGTVLLLPLDTQRQGKKKFSSPAMPFSPPTCPNP